MIVQIKSTKVPDSKIRFQEHWLFRFGLKIQSFFRDQIGKKAKKLKLYIKERRILS